MEDKCIINKCNNKSYCSGICSKHYTRFRRYESYDKPKNKRGELLDIGKSYCCNCKEEKSILEFHKDKQSYYGFSKICKICAKIKSSLRYINNKDTHRHFNLLKKFGISLDEYNIRLKEQSGKCMICCGKDNDKNMPVDHCHKTGKIRGILCSKCNLALGLFGDDINKLKSAIKYLNNSKTKINKLTNIK